MDRRRFTAEQGGFLALLWAVGLLLFQAIGAMPSPLWAKSWAGLLRVGLAELVSFLGPLALAGRKRRRAVLGPTVGSPRGRGGLMLLAVAMALVTYPAMLRLQTLYRSLLSAWGLTPEPISLPAIRSWAELALALMTVGVAAAFSEEVCLRGTLQPALRGPMGPAGALWITAVTFALLHMNYEALPYTLLLGALIGWLALRSRSLWPALAFHLTNNGLAVLVSAAGEPGAETALLRMTASVAAGIDRLSAPLPALVCGAVLAALTLLYRRVTPGAAPVEAGREHRCWYVPLVMTLGLLLLVLAAGLARDMKGATLCVSMWFA